MINNDELNRTLVQERQRDLARVASNGRFARMVRRGRRTRNPDDGPKIQPNSG